MPFSTGQINFPLFAEKLLAKIVASGVSTKTLLLTVLVLLALDFLPTSLLEAAMALRINFSICSSIRLASCFFLFISEAYLLSFFLMFFSNSFWVWISLYSWSFTFVFSATRRSFSFLWSARSLFNWVSSSVFTTICSPCSLRYWVYCFIYWNRLKA